MTTGSRIERSKTGEPVEVLHFASAGATRGATRKIVTDYWPKPIPCRNFDWSATFDNYDGPGSPIGTGATEQQAIIDLLGCED